MLHPKKWSAEVTQHSHALDLKKGVFKEHNPKKIARSIKKSAEESHSKKTSTYRSAMSMLSFYINRAGKNLTESQKNMLEQAKIELKALYHK